MKLIFRKFMQLSPQSNEVLEFHVNQTRIASVCVMRLTRKGLMIIFVDNSHVVNENVTNDECSFRTWKMNRRQIRYFCSYKWMTSRELGLPFRREQYLFAYEGISRERNTFAIQRALNSSPIQIGVFD